MRWITNDCPSVGDIRRVTKFLFFPKRIGFETRRLTKAAFSQEFVEEELTLPDAQTGYFYCLLRAYWRDKEWL